MLRKKILKVFIIFGILLAVTIGISIYAVNGYIDTHTWAVISVMGESHSDTADAFEEEHEYQKGDSISIGSVSLKISDITHSGDVSFTVERGNLYKKSIQKDTVSKNIKKSYKTDNGYVQVLVKSARYE